MRVVTSGAWPTRRRNVLAGRAAFSLVYEVLLEHIPDPFAGRGAGRGGRLFALLSEKLIWCR